MGYGGGGSIFGGQPPVYYDSYGRRSEGLLSDEEKRNISIAILALTAALTLIFTGGIFGLMDKVGEAPWEVAYLALVSFVSVTTGFFLHEMAHKFVAQHYGCWAEFRYSQQGLFIALFLAAFVGFLFAAPGAVYIAGRIDKRQNGIISIAGPLTNVTVALVAIPFFLVFDGVVASGFFTVIFFNSFLAVFNMIPIMPLDGAKVWRWDPVVYIVSILVMGGLMYFVWFVLG